VAQVVEHLLCKLDVPNPNSNFTQKKELMMTKSSARTLKNTLHAATHVADSSQPGKGSSKTEGK
jgi:hypothetical protein